MEGGKQGPQQDLNSPQEIRMGRKVGPSRWPASGPEVGLGN